MSAGGGADGGGAIAGATSESIAVKLATNTRLKDTPGLLLPSAFARRVTFANAGLGKRRCVGAVLARGPGVREVLTAARGELLVVLDWLWTITSGEKDV